ncbi:hypothetical protein SAMN05443634_105260 [Chishuiella changwenlii]|uniref:Uncharacterized protein n=1 Tax=Chishuiella changwenlii TaxID=1434701 RepID=A0A1M6XIN8_9FLAO|nr:hypothetical protein [Chishuiella changwenlii]GGF00928.1 hypothetical protein GCM10010984_18120 [Chishuiella changwenlii]SHL05773.1 hypothetical protein SAMN05443634_105260 [Chishuiella changwenlii]
MSAKKSVIEKFDNETLKTYILNNGRFTKEAKLLAFQILNEREYNFSENEIEFWNELKSDKIVEINKNKYVHPNYIKASNLIYLSGGLGLLSYFILGILTGRFEGVFEAIISIGVIFLIGYLLRKGISKMKYILLFLLIFGILISFQFLKFLIIFYPITAIIHFIQFILQSAAVVLLFLVPKRQKPN